VKFASVQDSRTEASTNKGLAPMSERNERTHHSANFTVELSRTFLISHQRPIEAAREQGLSIGKLRPVTAWPSLKARSDVR
jgi:hypothetical protein